MRGHIISDSGFLRKSRKEIDETDQEQRGSQRGQSLERQGINSSKLYAGKIEPGKYLLKGNGHS
jgi:hypothetical protein